MLEVLFSVFGELLIQVFGELLFELGFRALAEPFRREPNPWLAALAYAAFGAAVGGLSLLLLPTHLTPAGLLRTLNLIFTPIIAGLGMAAVGAWRARRGQPLLRIDRFLYGYVFALGLALVRFAFAA